MLELLRFHLCRRVCKGGLFVNPLLNNATLTGQRVRACVRACARVRVCVHTLAADGKNHFHAGWKSVNPGVCLCVCVCCLTHRVASVCLLKSSFTLL